MSAAGGQSHQKQPSRLLCIPGSDSRQPRYTRAMFPAWWSAEQIHLESGSQLGACLLSIGWAVLTVCTWIQASAAAGGSCLITTWQVVWSVTLCVSCFSAVCHLGAYLLACQHPAIYTKYRTAAVAAFYLLQAVRADVVLIGQCILDMPGMTCKGEGLPFLYATVFLVAYMMYPLKLAWMAWWLILHTLGFMLVLHVAGPHGLGLHAAAQLLAVLAVTVGLLYTVEQHARERFFAGASPNGQQVQQGQHECIQDKAAAAGGEAGEADGDDCSSAASSSKENNRDVKQLQQEQPRQEQLQQQPVNSDGISMRAATCRAHIPATSSQESSESATCPAHVPVTSAHVHAPAGSAVLESTVASKGAEMCYSSVMSDFFHLGVKLEPPEGTTADEVWEVQAAVTTQLQQFLQAQAAPGTMAPMIVSSLAISGCIHLLFDILQCCQPAGEGSAGMSVTQLLLPSNEQLYTTVAAAIPAGFRLLWVQVGAAAAAAGQGPFSQIALEPPVLSAPAAEAATAGSSDKVAAAAAGTVRATFLRLHYGQDLGTHTLLQGYTHLRLVVGGTSNGDGSSSSSSSAGRASGQFLVCDAHCPLEQLPAGGWQVELDLSALPTGLTAPHAFFVAVTARASSSRNSSSSGPAPADTLLAYLPLLLLKSSAAAELEQLLHLVRMAKGQGATYNQAYQQVLLPLCRDIATLLHVSATTAQSSTCAALIRSLSSFATRNDLPELQGLINSICPTCVTPSGGAPRVAADFDDNFDDPKEPASSSTGDHSYACDPMAKPGLAAVQPGASSQGGAQPQIQQQQQGGSGNFAVWGALIGWWGPNRHLEEQYMSCYAPSLVQGFLMAANSIVYTIYAMRSLFMVFAAHTPNSAHPSVVLSSGAEGIAAIETVWLLLCPPHTRTGHCARVLLTASLAPFFVTLCYFTPLGFKESIRWAIASNASGVGPSVSSVCLILHRLLMHQLPPPWMWAGLLAMLWLLVPRVIVGWPRWFWGVRYSDGGCGNEASAVGLAGASAAAMADPVLGEAVMLRVGSAAFELPGWAILIMALVGASACVVWLEARKRTLFLAHALAGRAIK